MAKYFYSRWTSLLGMIFCFGLLGFAAYLQLYLGLIPCPLCVLQRLLFLLLGFVFLVGALYTPHTRFGQHFHSGFVVIISLLGTLLSARHVWLTLQPPTAITTCSPTLEYMVQNLPLTETLRIMFLGSGDCGKVTYRLLTLSIPEWTVIAFGGFFIFGCLRYVFAKSEKA